MSTSATRGGSLALVLAVCTMAVLCSLPVAAQSDSLAPTTEDLPTAAPTTTTVAPATRAPATSPPAPTTPTPTYLTENDGESLTKVIYFGIAFVALAIPAVIACVCFAVRHQRRLDAIRALQENRASKSTELNTSSSTTFVPVITVHETGSSTPKAGEPIRQACDFNHTPPELALVAPSELFHLTPFAEDDAVIQDDVAAVAASQSSKFASVPDFDSQPKQESSSDFSPGAKAGGGRSAKSLAIASRAALGMRAPAASRNATDDANPFGVIPSTSSGSWNEGKGKSDW